MTTFSDPFSVTRDGETGHHSFVADVHFQSHIVWSGKVKVEWEPARAVMQDKKKHTFSEIEAESYTVSLHNMGGKSESNLLVP